MAWLTDLGEPECPGQQEAQTSGWEVSVVKKKKGGGGKRRTKAAQELLQD